MKAAAAETARPTSRARTPATPVDVDLERALEALFRLGANRRFNQRQVAAVGAVVTRAGYAVLRSLYDHGTLSVRRLAEACAMDAATASRQLIPLVRDGLVVRRVASDDGRRVEIGLTPRGREIYERVVAYRLRQLTSVVSDWPEEDRASLAALVSRLVRDLAPTASAGSAALRSRPHD